MIESSGWGSYALNSPVFYNENEYISYKYDFTTKNRYNQYGEGGLYD